jgi:hypothetical protein
MIRILKVYLKGKHKLLNKLSHKRFMGLLSKSNGIDDKCYTLAEIRYINSKM